ncbi:MAG TPA: LacI family DNA-binding transcriptional regulator [Chloroflexota bacterium]|nr:LacI family DNA-binding transcriptional regulator [Chloroflexota bacterium]
MTTIYDVAKAAQVTAATVSNVITGKGSVGAETRARVEAAIASLGYHPNMLARGLATRQTHTLGLLLPNIANPFYPEIALEVEQTARLQGYCVFLCNLCNDEEVGRTYLRQLANRQVDGAIVMPGGINLDDLVAAARGALPIVLCNWEEQDELPPLPMVGVSFFQAGCLAARHLLSLGHRRIGVIADAAIPHMRHTERVAGFAATIAQAGIAWDPRLLQLGDSTIASGYQAMTALRALADPPTAVFSTNDLMALGALESALALGLRVPRDLSIVGLDDISISAHTQPPLTTVTIPKRRIGAEATALLLQWLAKGEMPPIEPTQIPPTLHVRGSTARVGPGIEAPLAATTRALAEGAPREEETYRHILDPALPGP